MQIGRKHENMRKPIYSECVKFDGVVPAVSQFQKTGLFVYSSGAYTYFWKSA